MQPLRIEHATRILAEDQDEYFVLAIRDLPTEEGNAMVSKWEPTPLELAHLNAGGAVMLTIMGEVHPPVMVSTTPPLDGTGS